MKAYIVRVLPGGTGCRVVYSQVEDDGEGALVTDERCIRLGERLIVYKSRVPQYAAAQLVGLSFPSAGKLIERVEAAI